MKLIAPPFLLNLWSGIIQVSQHLSMFDVPHMPENQITTNFSYLTPSNFVIISHINYWGQVNSWKNFSKFWNGPVCINKSVPPSPLLNIAAYWQSSDTDACAKKLSQILSKDIDNGGRGIGLRSYVRYCRRVINWLFEELDFARQKSLEEKTLCNSLCDLQY